MTRLVIVGGRLLLLLCLLSTAKSLQRKGKALGALQEGSALSSREDVFAVGRALGRKLLQDPSPSPSPATPPKAVENAPSTAAIVGGVVGGLAGLTLVLAAALLFAAGSINRWWCCTSFCLLAGWGESDEGAGAHVSSPGTGLRSVRLLDLTDSGQALSNPASQSISASSNGPATAEVWGVLSSARDTGARESGSAVSPAGSQGPADTWGEMVRRATSQDGAGASNSTQRAHASSARAADLAWRECLIDPTKVLLLRRPQSQQLWRLGGGSFGQVYKALYDDVQVVAVKVLTGMADPAQLQAFLREGRILRHCRDPNIVQFVGAACDPASDQAMLVTEFMEAGDLWRALRWRDAQGHRVFGWYGRGKKAALDSARGLHYLHSHHVIHLDLKSANILLARDGTAKLADVGLAKTNLTKNYLSNVNTLGTFAWCAPEVLTGQKCDEKADIFSFGVVLWEICTGEMPSRGTMRNIEVPSECPPAVRDLCDRCMSADPRERPTAKQIVVALEAAGAGAGAGDARRGRRRERRAHAAHAERQQSILQEVAAAAGEEGAAVGLGPPQRGDSITPWQQLVEETQDGESNPSKRPSLLKDISPFEQVAHAMEPEAQQAQQGGAQRQSPSKVSPAALGTVPEHKDSLTLTSGFAAMTGWAWSSSSSSSGEEAGGAGGEECGGKEGEETGVDRGEGAGGDRGKTAKEGEANGALHSSAGGNGDEME